MASKSELHSRANSVLVELRKLEVQMENLDGAISDAGLKDIDAESYDAWQAVKMAKRETQSLVTALWHAG
jgi:hypothetical protein